MIEVAVPAERVPRWVDNFRERHGPTVLGVHDSALTGAAADGSSFSASLPFSAAYTGTPDIAVFLAAVGPPADWGVLLVRKGGFAVARLSGPVIKESKVGQRHVQGRTKAGGQSQQRFARRRGNQARIAYEAAAEHAVRLVADVPVAVVGGDATAIAAVLEDPRLQQFADRVVGPVLTVADPRRSVLEAACQEAQAVRISVQNA